MRLFYTSDPLFLGNIAPENNNTIYILMNYETQVDIIAGVVFLLSAFKADKPVITIFMIGDSTMANKSLTGGNPERGWGQMLPGYLSEEIRVDNHAVNGRSSKSFIDEDGGKGNLTGEERGLCIYSVRT